MYNSLYVQFWIRVKKQNNGFDFIDINSMLNF